MLTLSNAQEAAHLIELIRQRSNGIPSFALLIGAGASATSGVKTSSEMIEDWRRRLHEQSDSQEPLEEWLEDQDWFQKANEYSILFESVFDEAAQRRIYIEECVKDARPCWGYIYLANLVAKGYFNVVFTTNFDDLLNEACFIYTDIKPIVCAHDSAVQGVRITSARPKIIKLHGDFLYDNIKNTREETEELEKNMQDKFQQFAREYGLIVIGYGGNDASVMKIIRELSRSDVYFPHGVYWCMRKGSSPSKRLQSLLKSRRHHLVYIDGFDEFMAELHESLSVSLPSTVRDPFKAVTERLNASVLTGKEVSHHIVKRDVEHLMSHVQDFESLVSMASQGQSFDRLVPYQFLADTEARNQNFEASEQYYKKALLQDPSNYSALWGLARACAAMERYDDALQIADKMTTQQPRNYRGFDIKGFVYMIIEKPDDALKALDVAIEVVQAGSPEAAHVLASKSNAHLQLSDWANALSSTEEALHIVPIMPAALLNKALALKKLGKAKESKAAANSAMKFMKDPYTIACALAVLGEKEEMLRELKYALRDNKWTRILVRTDPEFHDFREDADFQALLAGV